MIAFGFSVAVTLMLAIPVSAGIKMIVAQDRSGDLMQRYDAETADIVGVWGNNTPIASVGYFDMLSYSLAQKGDTYTFEMQVAADLPKEGSALPSGFKQVMWVLWIDAEPWNPVYNPSAAILFTIDLMYDGVKYVAELKEGPTSAPVLANLPFTIDGSKVQLQFSADSIGDMKSFWWSPGTRVQWGPLGTSGFWTFEAPDPGAVPGQVWWDLPWGNPVWTP